MTSKRAAEIFEQVLAAPDGAVIPLADEQELRELAEILTPRPEIYIGALRSPLCTFSRDGIAFDARGADVLHTVIDWARVCDMADRYAAWPRVRVEEPACPLNPEAAARSSQTTSEPK